MTVSPTARRPARRGRVLGGGGGPVRGPRTPIRDASCCDPPANWCPIFASRTTQGHGHQCAALRQPGRPLAGQVVHAATWTVLRHGGPNHLGLWDRLLAPPAGSPDPWASAGPTAADFLPLWAGASPGTQTQDTSLVIFCMSRCPDFEFWGTQGSPPRLGWTRWWTRWRRRSSRRCVVQTFNPGHQLLWPPANWCPKLVLRTTQGWGLLTTAVVTGQQWDAPNCCE